VSGGRDEVEAAYFTLLRARAELSALQGYTSYVRAEAQRLRRSLTEDEALRAGVDARLRRLLRGSDEELVETIQRRLGLLEDEAVRLPARVEAAELFVLECERHHEVLRGRA